MFNALIHDLFGVEIHKKRNIRPDNSPCVIDCRNEITAFDNREHVIESMGAKKLIITQCPHLNIQHIFGYESIELIADEVVINDEIVDAKSLNISANMVTVNQKVDVKQIALRPGSTIRVLNPESDLKNITDESYFVFVVPTSNSVFMYTVPEGTTLLDLVKPKINTENTNEVLCELLRRIFPTGHNFGEVDEDVIKLLEETFIKEGKISKEEVIENIGKYFKQEQPERVVVNVKGKTTDEVLNELKEKKEQKSKETSKEDVPLVEHNGSTLITIDEEEIPTSSKHSNKASAKKINKQTTTHGNIVLSEE